MNLAASLIAISLLLLVGLGVGALFLAGRDSAGASDDDPPPPGPRDPGGSGG